MSILATRGHHWHHDTMVAPPMAPLGCVQCAKFQSCSINSMGGRAKNINCPWSSLCMLRLEHTHRDKQHSTVSQTFSFVSVKILFHFLSPSKQRKVPGNSSIHLNMRLDFLKISFVSLPPQNIMMGL